MRASDMIWMNIVVRYFKLCESSSLLRAYKSSLCFSCLFCFPGAFVFTKKNMFSKKTLQQGYICFILKISVIGWLGKKYDDLLRIINVRGKRWKKGERIIFLLYLGKKISFWKGGGAKISIIWIIYTPGLLFS